jgi:hypothetical protein
MNKSDEEANQPTNTSDQQPLSRRRFLQVSVAGAALSAAGGLSACMPSGTGTRTPGSTPKVLALYRDSPNEGRRCAGCTHFIEPNACDIVAGEISPNGWCRYHEPLPG